MGRPPSCNCRCTSSSSSGCPCSFLDPFDTDRSSEYESLRASLSVSGDIGTVTTAFSDGGIYRELSTAFGASTDEIGVEVTLMDNGYHARWGIFLGDRLTDETNYVEVSWESSTGKLHFELKQPGSGVYQDFITPTERPTTLKISLLPGLDDGTYMVRVYADGVLQGWSGGFQSTGFELGATVPAGLIAYLGTGSFDDLCFRECLSSSSSSSATGLEIVAANASCISTHGCNDLTSDVYDEVPRCWELIVPVGGFTGILSCYQSATLMWTADGSLVSAVGECFVWVGVLDATTVLYNQCPDPGTGPYVRYRLIYSCLTDKWRLVVTFSEFGFSAYELAEANPPDFSSAKTLSRVSGTVGPTALTVEAGSCP